MLLPSFISFLDFLDVFYKWKLHFLSSSITACIGLAVILSIVDADNGSASPEWHRDPVSNIDDSVVHLKSRVLVRHDTSGDQFRL